MPPSNRLQHSTGKADTLRATQGLGFRVSGLGFRERPPWPHAKKTQPSRSLLFLAVEAAQASEGKLLCPFIRRNSRCLLRAVAVTFVGTLFVSVTPYPTLHAMPTKVCACPSRGLCQAHESLRHVRESLCHVREGVCVCVCHVHENPPKFTTLPKKPLGFRLYTCCGMERLN